MAKNKTKPKEIELPRAVRVSVESGSDSRVFSNDYAMPVKIFVGDDQFFPEEESEPIPQAVRAWLQRELAATEATLHLGPGGIGWMHNEQLRPPVEERAAWLRAILS